ncbi:MAG: transglycosylase domain-containing protein [Phototrophicaceae bacterium]
MPNNFDLPEIDPENNDDEITEPRPRAQNMTESMNLDAVRATDDPNYEDQVYDPDEDVPFKLPKLSNDEAVQPTVNPRHNPNAMPTMPHFREPGMVDPKITLAGTGGLDPNPDMMSPVPDPSHGQQTVMNMPKAPQQAPAQMTQANPNTSDARYQRPNNPTVQSAQGQYVPPPPQRQQRANDQKQLPPRRPRSKKIMGLPAGCVYMFLGLMVTFCGGLTLLTAGAAAIFIPRIEAQWGSEVERVDGYRAFESTFYFDRYGNSLYESFIEGRRDVVRYDQFPVDLINASVSIEDDTFWSNIGIDIAATGVATLNFLGAGGERVPGGSTITQQVVRNILFTNEYRNEVSVTRKVEEIILALFLTQRRSKQDIMTLYLNEIYYGNLAYGAQAAAQTLFGKDVADLTLGESALLAGLPQAPSTLDPLNPDPEVQSRLFGRWRLVLDEMVEEGYITSAERSATLAQGLTFVERDANNLEAPHFTIYAQNEFEDLMTDIGFSPQDLTTGGFRIYTTLDQNVNNIALGAARTQIANIANRNASNAAVVVIQPLTGQIIGMVGSIDYNNDAIDGNVNVTISLRQPGSTMKPFTYAAAMELGMTAGDVLWDTPVEVPQAGQAPYVPVNYDRSFHGPMTIRRALANSYNIPAVQALRLTGVDYLLNMMDRVGVSTLTDPSRYGISLTLGGGEVSLLELTNAYGVFANVGTYVPPTSILCVIDSNDNIVYQYEGGCPQGAGTFTSNTIDRRGFGEQVLDPRIAFTITDILSDNAARSPAMGGNSPLNTPSIGTAAKTGTTNDIKDNWTIGYTRNVVIGVWVGNNNGDPMVNSSGLTSAAPIWNSIMTSIYNNASALDVFRSDGQLLPDIPNPPQGVSLVQICDVRSISDGATGCPRATNEWLLDSPAYVPDGNGNLVTPQQPLARSSQSDNVTEISPDIYRTLAYRLNPGIAAGLQFNLQPGDLPPPAPLYCRVPQSLQGQALGAGASDQVFIAPPNTSHNDRVRAETWAQQNGFAMLPTIDCWDGAFDAGVNFGSGIVTAAITSPTSGQTVGNPLSIIGTVQFDNSQADFWHLDIIGGNFADWTPMGNAGYNNVNNGELFTGFLDSGSYRVRLRLSKDGNMVQQPYEVSFVVP